MAPSAAAAAATAAAALLFVLLHLPIPPPSKPAYHSLFLSLASNATAARHLLALTRRPHVAGSDANEAAAAYVLASLSSAASSVHIISYDVLLSYPLHRSLSLSLEPSAPASFFDLVQEIYPGDPFADVASEVIATFHAYARSGSAAGRVVYANYGRVEDFAALRAAGVEVAGNVVLARYGNIYRGDIVRNAQLAGASAAIVYTDAKDYGGRNKWFPDDRWMPPSGVQVGSTYSGIGDPTTPGWASVGSCERISADEVVTSGLMPAIPSLPVSSRDGETILRTIGGEVAAEDWQGGEGAPVYRLGPGPGIVNLTYTGNETIMAIQNVIAVIEGKEEPDRYVILGNHRDAWTFGAVDPNSGTTAMLGVAERFEMLQKRGWRPRRSIVLCSWDAEEYGLIGSTEWVEDNREILTSRAVAYLNVDTAVSGPGFGASSTPQLDELIEEAAKMVPDPDNSSQTLYESWVTSGSPFIGRLGGGGTDFAAFVQHVGVPSVDMSFGQGISSNVNCYLKCRMTGDAQEKSCFIFLVVVTEVSPLLKPVDYPVYHSMYDDFIWMQKYGDPQFHRHVAAANIWGLIALKLADKDILPFDYMTYAYELEARAWVGARRAAGQCAQGGGSACAGGRVGQQIGRDRRRVLNGGRVLIGGIGAVETLLCWQRVGEQSLRARGCLLDCGWQGSERGYTHLRLGRVAQASCDRVRLDERQEHCWRKIYGPSQYNHYGSKSFPGIVDAIQNSRTSNTSESWRLVQHEVWRVARAITQASLVLNGDLT
ncbi:putative glutamate carboxypeptidase 2 [Apostasia shenzhenica]|uniref:Putative glutamate carboxypeptidase 2 n=1 Tax=Apostasia shenzhenica TaxID=1088818 RepID=A0A2I0ANW4_9ASPA|nr:putative glutamate carboxypeptidase 2 [Apostasia shenzhenica]